MKNSKGILFLYSQSFLHPGAGASAGVIDLPIQREVHTKYPVISASGLKGSLRDLAEKKSLPKGLVEGIFGPEIKKGGKTEEKGFAGALVIGDAKLLAMPIRSFTRSFFWVTSPLALGRFGRDLRIMGVETKWEEIKVEAETKTAYVPDVPENHRTGETLFLEELDFQMCPDGKVTAFTQFLAGQLGARLIGGAYHDKLQRDLAVISDSDFNYLVRFGTQVTARTKLTSLKTTDTIKNGDQIEKGNLWYEETLPPESIFYAPVLAEPARNADDTELDSGEKVLGNLEERILTENFIQVGGNETLGQGWCAVSLLKGGVAS